MITDLDVVLAYYIQILIWFWPLASSLPLDSGLEFEVNEFEGELAFWRIPLGSRTKAYTHRWRRDMATTRSRPNDCAFC